MNPPALNRALADNLLVSLHAAGVRTICLCPGGRNAPLVLAFDAARDAFDVVTFFEERSAAFFAIGRIRRDHAPVAVVTTSGTAAAELLPAMLEARYAALPLVAITADRPKSLRGTGAPQSIDQSPLFTAAHANVIDLDSPESPILIPPFTAPLHINLCFDEPLVSSTHPPTRIRFSHPAPPAPSASWMTKNDISRACDDFFQRVKSPLILVSSLSPQDADALAPWLAAQPAPSYLEAVSQLRNHPHLQNTSLHSGERILNTSVAESTFDGILRIGGVPTPRFWRNCDASHLPILHISSSPFPGTARPSSVVPLDAFLSISSNYQLPQADVSALLNLDRSIARKLKNLLASDSVHPMSEPALITKIEERMPDNARIFLGNSLSIRQWDLASSRTSNARHFFANRGVNGIDGLVSSALGLADSDRPLVAMIGDLSALYDLAGLWPAAQIASKNITLVVVNNSGGQIFERMFHNPAFLNSHRLDLSHWAAMFQWSYQSIRTPDFSIASETPQIVEVFSDPDATKHFYTDYEALWL